MKTLIADQPISKEPKEQTDKKKEPLDKRIVKNRSGESHFMNEIERKKPEREHKQKGKPGPNKNVFKGLIRHRPIQKLL
jgi:hypothetical protein